MAFQISDAGTDEKLSDAAAKSCQEHRIGEERVIFAAVWPMIASSGGSDANRMERRSCGDSFGYSARRFA
jgi:hypothetical protein